jgi:hypothetical protein
LTFAGLASTSLYLAIGYLGIIRKFTDLTPELDVFDEFLAFARKKERGVKIVENIVGEQRDQNDKRQCNCNTVCYGARSLVQEPPHCCCNVRHPAGKAPFIVVPS